MSELSCIWLQFSISKAIFEGCQRKLLTKMKTFVNLLELPSVII